jgi:hypothetical protein
MEYTGENTRLLRVFKSEVKTVEGGKFNPHKIGIRRGGGREKGGGKRGNDRGRKRGREVMGRAGREGGGEFTDFLPTTFFTERVCGIIAKNLPQQV